MTAKAYGYIISDIFDKADDTMKKCKFDITGMTCSSCQAHVEKAVKKLDGMQNVNVNLLSNSMNVEFDEKKVNEELIIKAVENAGYGATIREKIVQNQAEKHDQNLNLKEESTNLSMKQMKHRLIISVCFLIPLMYIAMHSMLLEWFEIPVPVFIQNSFDGMENSLILALTEFVLLLPILYVNRNYFIKGFKTLWKLHPNMDSLIAIGSTASTVYSIYSTFMIAYRIWTWGSRTYS